MTKPGRERPEIAALRHRREAHAVWAVRNLPLADSAAFPLPAW